MWSYGLFIAFIGFGAGSNMINVPKDKTKK